MQGVAKMIWFTADLHLGHTNIIKYCDRPFAGVNEMDEAIVLNFARMIHPDDTLYLIGDTTFIKDASLWLNRIPGHKILIRGNHDHKNPEGYDKIYDTKLIRHQGHKIWLSHYSHRVWPESHRGAIHLFGHSHGTLPGFGRSFDVGVDTNNFRPYSIDKILKIGLNLDFEGVDHHLEAFKDCV